MRSIKLDALIELLQVKSAKYGGSMEVFIASDEEGNSFGSLKAGEDCFIVEYDKLLIFPYEQDDPEEVLVQEDTQ